MQSVLIIDDDLDLCRLLSDYLEGEGIKCACAHDGPAGLQAAKQGGSDIDVIILDVMLPGKNGFEVLTELKGCLTAPVIMLTAKGDPVDTVVGLEMGADDYMSKPFNPRELLARIRTVLRRAKTPIQEPSILSLGEFKLDKRSFQASCQGHPLNLTAVEFKILWLLLASSGTIVSRETLFQGALGRREHNFDRSLDMHISRLRKKISVVSDCSSGLKSIRGEGYLFTPWTDGDEKL
jgi:two-component system response regulator CpxR